MPNIFFTADLHLGHDNIIKYAQRPFTSIEEHDDTLINNYNKTVSKKDIVYILGDFAWRNHKKYISALNGKKILIIGNHDKMSQFDYSMFTEVCFVKELKHNGKKIFLSHYPHKSWNGSCHCYKVNSNFLGHLYGHCHGRMQEDRASFDVGVDVWQYKPLHIDTAIKKLQWLSTITVFAENDTVSIDNSRWL